jgi:hypothetical protein
MEFYASIPIECDETWLQRQLQIASLAQGCSAIERVLFAEGERGEIFCLWGQFEVRRETLRSGVRFSLPGCPNALAWTITREESKSTPEILIHCTINRQTQDSDFVASLREFVEAWRNGLPALLSPG